ncbi:hypothetical protein [Bifidobacterium parmae]|uniref:Uncharacterized protein n=1 Tax=Bifidobacterium parmae TaxID=361854 RepID=A0A2N5IVN3_9BIFI|nr:hypothetical protein [Bifidobacterium parmae]PLS26013.1 hypothetical protein Uis4E_2188 [Bifidobacterium parmae]
MSTPTITIVLTGMRILTGTAIALAIGATIMLAAILHDIIGERRHGYTRRRRG